MSLTDEYWSAKRKRENEEVASYTSGGSSGDLTSEYWSAKRNNRPTDDDIAPVGSSVYARYVDRKASKKRLEEEWKNRKKDKEKEKEEEKEKERKWFQKGAFDDGYDFGDITKTILGTVGDVGENLLSGVVGMGEKVLDASYLLAPALNEAYQAQNDMTHKFDSEAYNKDVENAKEFVKKDLYDEEQVAKAIVDPGMNLFGVSAEKDSVLGEKSDALAQSGGQLLATAGLQAVGVPWWVTSGTTSFGGELEGALNEGATTKEAVASAAITAGAEIFSEKISGGISFGGKTMDEGLTQLLARGISNKTWRTMAKLGVDMAGEGAEEVFSQVMSNIGSSLYKDESMKELLFSEQAVEEYVESFIGGAALGGIGSSVNAVKSNRNGVDYVSGMTANEQKVVDQVYKDRVAEAEKAGKVSQKEKSDIYDEVIEDMEQGFIETETIEEILDGDSVKAYRDLQQEADEYKTLYETESGKLSEKQKDRLAELKEKNKINPYETALKDARSKISEDVSVRTKGDRLAESYNERARRGQAYEADLSKYDKKQQATIQKAVDSGILNNTRRTHEFVDFVAKIAADTGTTFDFADNAKIKESGFAVEGYTVDGFHDKANKSITVNIDSPKSRRFVVGHEITHALEGSQMYGTLRDTLFEYAKMKKQYDERMEGIRKRYKEGTDFEAELTADLVGEYIFSDVDFVNHLTQNRNLFQRVFDEVKYLCKVATAGSKEARELEKVKRTFEKAYRDAGKDKTEARTEARKEKPKKKPAEKKVSKKTAEKISRVQEMLEQERRRAEERLAKEEAPETVEEKVDQPEETANEPESYEEILEEISNEPVEEVSEETVEEAVEEPVEAPVNEEVAEEPIVEEPAVEETIEESSEEVFDEEALEESLEEKIEEAMEEFPDEPIKEIVEAPVEESFEEPDAESIKETIDELLEEMSEEPVEETAEEPAVEETVEEPAEEVAEETVEETDEAPVAEEVVEETAEESAEEDIEAPVAEEVVDENPEPEETVEEEIVEEEPAAEESYEEVLKELSEEPAEEVVEEPAVEEMSEAPIEEPVAEETEQEISNDDLDAPLEESLVEEENITEAPVAEEVVEETSTPEEVAEEYSTPEESVEEKESPSLIDNGSENLLADRDRFLNTKGVDSVRTYIGNADGYVLYGESATGFEDMGAVVGRQAWRTVYDVARHEALADFYADIRDPGSLESFEERLENLKIVAGKSIDEYHAYAKKNGYEKAKADLPLAHGFYIEAYNIEKKIQEIKNESFHRKEHSDAAERAGELRRELDDDPVSKLRQQALEAEYSAIKYGTFARHYLNMDTPRAAFVVKTFNQSLATKKGFSEKVDFFLDFRKKYGEQLAKEYYPEMYEACEEYEASVLMLKNRMKYLEKGSLYAEKAAEAVERAKELRRKLAETTEADDGADLFSGLFSEDIQYSLSDSDGKQLTKEQQEYFKDSKIVDKKGRLKVVYHGTKANFNTFKKGDIGYHFGNKSTARTRVGRGKDAKLIESYLNITNPIEFDYDLGSWDADYRLAKELVEREIITKAEYRNVLVSDAGYRRSSGDANKVLRKILQDKGYDGITYRNTFESNGSTSYIVFDSNQAKLTTNEKPSADPDIRFSLSDSTGRQLSEEQSIYFRDSKVRDENGNLKVIYHGTPNGEFTVFKDGTYFTDNKEYADRYQNPGASSIKTGKTASNPKTFEVYLDIKKPFDIKDAEARSIYINDYIKGGNAMGINPYLSDKEYAKINSIDWTEGEDLREFLIDNGYDYDGLVLDEGGTGGYGDEVQSRGKSYVVFSPEQVKNVDNLTPTSDPDIRFSLSDNRTYAEIEEERAKLRQQEIALDRRKQEAVNNPELLQVMDEYSGLFTELRGLLSRKRQGTATQAELDRIEEIKKLREEKMNRVAELQESLGLNAIAQEEAEIRERKESLRVASDAAWEREGAERENKAIEKAGVPAPEYFRKKALKAFRTTANFNEAGYMLPDGKLLNFSGGERNHRYRDHREIGEIYEATNGVAALNRFLSDGNIRIMAESPGIDIASGVEPTKEQYAALRRFINTNGAKDGQFFVDFSGTDGRNVGKYAYNGRIIADRIINDIKYFYQTGKVRESSGLLGFLSISNVGEQHTADSLSALKLEVPAAENATVQGKVQPMGENATVAESPVSAEDERSLFPDEGESHELEDLISEEAELRGVMEAYAGVGDIDAVNKFIPEHEAIQARIKELQRPELERADSLTDADAPPEMDAPIAMSSENYDPFGSTTLADISRSTRSYSDRNPGARNYLEQAALGFLYDVNNSMHGERWYNDQLYYDTGGEKGFGGTKRVTTDDIADLKDTYGYTWDELRKAAERVADGDFRSVAAKRVEYLCHKRLMEGYTDVDGRRYEPDQDYISFLNETFANEQRAGGIDNLLENADQYAPEEIDMEDIAPVLTPETHDAEKEGREAPLYEGAEGQQAMFPEAEPEKPLTRKVLHSNIIESIKTRFKEKGFDFDNVLKKAKNLSTWATVDNTPQRVMEKALGYKEGGVLADITVNQVAQNESEGIKWLNSMVAQIKQISKEYHIKPGSKESKAAQMYAEGFFVDENNNIIRYGDPELIQDFRNPVVRQNIKKLARDPRIRKIYDDTLARINESRKRNAYPEIPRLDNYFLHFRAMEDTFSRLGLPFNPNDIRAKDLPTDLNGVTADLKPGQPYFASAMHRTGKRTSFDLLGGLEKYLASAKNQIYHIDDIQTLRALRNYIAKTYGQATGLEDIDSMTDEEAQQRIEQVYGSHLSTFAKFLNEEANVLAGKTALIDRGLEGIIGRRGITFLNTLNGQVGRNMVGYNASSSLTNFLPVAQTFAKSNKFAFTKAFAQTVANKLSGGKFDSFAEDSPVMIRRKGADRFYQTPWQKMANPGYALMGIVDDISTEIIARTKYNEFVRKGMDSQKAHFETDKWVSKLMGDRSLGQQPQLYNSKMLGLVTKFQLEVRNQLDAQFYDTIQETKVSNEHIQNGLARNAKTAAQVASTFAQLAVAQHLYGVAFEAIAGYNPAFDIIEVLMTAFGFDDDEESEDTALDNFTQGLLALAEDMPYASTFTGGRIPISDAIPDVNAILRGEDEYGNEIGVPQALWDNAKEIAPYYLMPAGYGQLKKSVAGLKMFSDDHPIAGSYTDSGNLRFPVEDTLGNRIKAGVFGQYASENARKYFDEEQRTLNPEQTEIFAGLDIPIEEYWEYRDNLNKFYGVRDALKEAAYADDATDDDVLRYTYINNVYGNIYDLYDQQKEIASGDGSNKKSELRNLQTQMEQMLYESKFGVDRMKLSGAYGEVGGRRYNKDADSGKWYEIKAKNADGSDNRYYRKEQEVTKALGISYEEYWNNREEYNYAYDKPEQYALAQAVGGYTSYRSYSSELYDIKADKDENGKSISGSRKEKVIDYINNLDADYGEKIILFKSEYNSDDSYNYDIIEYLNSRDDISYAQMESILKYLGFTVDSEGNISW